MDMLHRLIDCHGARLPSCRGLHRYYRLLSIWPLGVEERGPEGAQGQPTQVGIDSEFERIDEVLRQDDRWSRRFDAGIIEPKPDFGRAHRRHPDRVAADGEDRYPSLHLVG